MFEEDFAKFPAEPPRPLSALPGLRLRGAIPKAALIVPLFFLAFFVVVPLSIVTTDPAARLQMGPSDTAQGRVVSNRSALGCRGEASHHVTYAFSARSGNEYRGGATLCEESPYYSAKEGDAIEVRYLKGDPAINSILGEHTGEPPPFAVFFFMPFFFLAIFGSLFWPQIREVLRARRLYRKGRLAVGTVVFVKKRYTSIWPGMPGSGACEIYIAIENSDGVSREAVASCQNDWLLNQLAPGSTVHVAYVDGRSEKAALLEAYWR